MDIRGSRRALMSERYALAASAPPTSRPRRLGSTDTDTATRRATAGSQFGADTHTAHTSAKQMAAATAHSAPAPSERRSETRAGSRRIFPPQFKLQVLDAYRRDTQCRGNQRATARKFGIHRRQIQKWLQAEPALRAALLRRAPQPAPSPPPYSVGSPESARLPTPPPAPASLPTAVALPTPLPAPIPVIPPTTEPIDLSMRRLSAAPVSVLTYAPSSVPEQQPRKPFKLFRPYLLDEEDKKPALASLPVAHGHLSAFVPVQGAAGWPPTACAPRWCAAAPSYSAPLR